MKSGLSECLRPWLDKPRRLAGARRDYNAISASNHRSARDHHHGSGQHALDRVRQDERSNPASTRGGFIIAFSIRAWSIQGRSHRKGSGITPRDRPTRPPLRCRAPCVMCPSSARAQNAKLLKGHDTDPGSRLGKTVRSYRLKQHKLFVGSIVWCDPIILCSRLYGLAEIQH